MSLPKNGDPDKTNSQIADESVGPSCACALLTGPGRSAVAVIGVRGESASELVSCGFAPATPGPLDPGFLRYGRWIGNNDVGESAGESVPAESVVVVPLAADDLEVHCHGGVAASTRILDDLQCFGAICLSASDWQIRPDTPLLIQEAEQVLTRCLTAPMAAVAMDQIRGAMLDWCHQALASAQRASDSACHTICEQAKRILQFKDLGLRLSHRYRVVLLGPPNVGKSSLVNAIVGYDRSITMDLAGTTRDVLHADTVLAGIPIRLSDTAGLRTSEHQIEREGVARAQTAAEEADLVVLVQDPDTPAMEPPSAKRSILVLNKSDLADAQAGIEEAMIRTVATNGQGVDDLMDAIARRLVDFPPPGSPVPVTGRQVELLEQLTQVTEPDQASMLLKRLIDYPNISSMPSM